MLTKTRGIVLHHIPYSDSAIIVKIYTENFGLVSYISQGLKGTKKPLRNYLTRPLSLMKMEVYHRPTRDVQRIKEAEAEKPFHSIPFDPDKRSAAFFIAETILRAVKEEEANPDLFGFLVQTTHQLDDAPIITCDFCLLFLIQLSRYLGFFPQNNFSTHSEYFDLRNGKFTPFAGHPDFIHPPLSRILSSVIGKTSDSPTKEMIFPDMAKELLGKLVLYYRIHLPGMHRIRSLELMYTDGI
ncbi:MAG: DNA repair protein RecO [Bacteroidetes bacterium]|nr:DNA repair protein RecO [Bacteroidota bacterium]